MSLYLHNSFYWSHVWEMHTLDPGFMLNYLWLSVHSFPSTGLTTVNHYPWVWNQRQIQRCYLLSKTGQKLFQLFYWAPEVKFSTSDLCPDRLLSQYSYLHWPRKIDFQWLGCEVRSQRRSVITNVGLSELQRGSWTVTSYSLNETPSELLSAGKRARESSCLYANAL